MGPPPGSNMQAAMQGMQGSMPAGMMAPPGMGPPGGMMAPPGMGPPGGMMGPPGGMMPP